jgi:hypothetical protein
MLYELASVLNEPEIVWERVDSRREDVCKEGVLVPNQRKRLGELFLRVGIVLEDEGAG